MGFIVTDANGEGVVEIGAGMWVDGEGCFVAAVLDVGIFQDFVDIGLGRLDVELVFGLICKGG